LKLPAGRFHLPETGYVARSFFIRSQIPSLLKNTFMRLAFAALLFPALLSAQSHQWSFNPGAGQNDQANAIVLDAAGNSYLTGNFRDTVDFDPGSGTALRAPVGDADVFVASYSAAGALRWVSVMGGPGSDAGLALALDGNGKVNVTGSFFSNTDADPGAGVVMLSATANGTFVWQLNQASGSLSQAIAIDGASAGCSIAVDMAARIYVTGKFSATADFDPGAGTAMVAPTGGSEDIFIARYDGALNYQLAFALGGPSNDNGLALCCDISGNVYAAGTCTGSIDLDPGAGTAMSGAGGLSEGWMASYDINGAFRWGFGIHGTGSDGVNGLTLRGNSLYAGGHFSATVDLDPSGASANLSASGGEDIFFAAYSLNGSYQWAKRFGDSYDDRCKAICTDPAGDIYITGFFSDFLNGVDFDPGSEVYPIYTHGGNDVFVARYNMLGDFIWAFSMGSASNDSGNGVAAGSGFVCVAGGFEGQMDFDPAGNTAMHNTAAGSDAFVARYSSVFVGIEEVAAAQISLYPQPAASQLTASLPGRWTSYCIYNAAGKLMHQQNGLFTGSFSIDISALSPGIYLLRVSGEDKEAAARFMVR
jgi:hypothetical protein